GSDRVHEVATCTLESELGAGYASRAHLIELLGDALADNEQDVTDEQVHELVDTALAERRHAEQSWTTPTDHDRVVAALDELDRSGIVSRECFGATIRDAER